MILSAPLSDASVERVISSEVPTGMPAWNAHRNAFVYVSERSGSSAIWMRGEDGGRSVVTVDSFPSRRKFRKSVIRGDRLLLKFRRWRVFSIS
jgi:hypothetical protein